MSRKQEKVTALLAELAAEFIAREATSDPLITVTRADISPDLKQASVFVSVFPDDKEEAALAFLSRKRYDFKEFVGKEARLRVQPDIDFKLDLGEKNRRRLEEISKK